MAENPSPSIRVFEASRGILISLISETDIPFTAWREVMVTPFSSGFVKTEGVPPRFGGVCFRKQRLFFIGGRS